MGEDNRIKEENSNSNSQGNTFFQLCNMVSKLAKFVLQAILKVVQGMADMLNSLYKKILSAILRSAFAVMLVSFSLDYYVLHFLVSKFLLAFIEPLIFPTNELLISQD